MRFYTFSLSVIHSCVFVQNTRNGSESLVVFPMFNVCSIWCKRSVTGRNFAANDVVRAVSHSCWTLCSSCEQQMPYGNEWQDVCRGVSLIQTYLQSPAAHWSQHWEIQLELRALRTSVGNLVNGFRDKTPRRVFRCGTHEISSSLSSSSLGDCCFCLKAQIKEKMIRSISLPHLNCLFYGFISLCP